MLFTYVGLATTIVGLSAAATISPSRLSIIILALGLMYYGETIQEFMKLSHCYTRSGQHQRIYTQTETCLIDAGFVYTSKAVSYTHSSSFHGRGKAIVMNAARKKYRQYCKRTKLWPKLPDYCKNPSYFTELVQKAEEHDTVYHNYFKWGYLAFYLSGGIITLLFATTGLAMKLMLSTQPDMDGYDNQEIQQDVTKVVGNVMRNKKGSFLMVPNQIWSLILEFLLVAMSFGINYLIFPRYVSLPFHQYNYLRDNSYILPDYRKIALSVTQEAFGTAKLANVSPMDVVYPVKLSCSNFPIGVSGEIENKDYSCTVVANQIIQEATLHALFGQFFTLTVIVVSLFYHIMQWIGCSTVKSRLKDLDTPNNCSGIEDRRLVCSKLSWSQFQCLLTYKKNITAEQTTQAIQRIAELLKEKQ
jgi:hypothetical protein